MLNFVLDSIMIVIAFILVVSILQSVRRRSITLDRFFSDLESAWREAKRNFSKTWNLARAKTHGDRVRPHEEEPLKKEPPKSEEDDYLTPEDIKELEEILGVKNPDPETESILTFEGFREDVEEIFVSPSVRPGFSMLKDANELIDSVNRTMHLLNVLDDIFQPFTSARLSPDTAEHTLEEFERFRNRIARLAVAVTPGADDPTFSAYPPDSLEVINTSLQKMRKIEQSLLDYYLAVKHFVLKSPAEGVSLADFLNRTVDSKYEENCEIEEVSQSCEEAYPFLKDSLDLGWFEHHIKDYARLPALIKAIAENCKTSYIEVPAEWLERLEELDEAETYCEIFVNQILRLENEENALDLNPGKIPISDAFSQRTLNALKDAIGMVTADVSSILSSVVALSKVDSPLACDVSRRLYAETQELERNN